MMSRRILIITALLFGFMGCRDAATGPPAHEAPTVAPEATPAEGEPIGDAIAIDPPPSPSVQPASTEPFGEGATARFRVLSDDFRGVWMQAAPALSREALERYSQPSTRRRSLLKPGRPRVRGSLDKEIIRKMINRHKRSFSECYESALERGLDHGGTVEIRFMLQATGTVLNARVERDTLGDAGVTACLLEHVRELHFPQCGGGLVDIVYPFVFKDPPTP